MGKNKNKENLRGSSPDYHETYWNIYHIWNQRLLNMAISCIKWSNTNYYENFCVPERFLVYEGKVMAAYDEDLGHFILPCVASNSLNDVGEASRYRAYSKNGWTSRLYTPNKDCVIIYNNPLGLPDIHVISYYAEKLTDLEITKRVNLNSNKTPLGITVPESQYLTALNQYNEISLGKPVIFKRDEINIDDYKTLLPTVPFIVPQLTLEIKSLWGDWLTYLGVPSMDITKNERFLKDEIAEVRGGAIASRTSRIGLRRAAVEKYNEIYGTNWKVEYSVDIEPVPNFLNNDFSDIDLSE